MGKENGSDNLRNHKKEEKEKPVSLFISMSMSSLETKTIAENIK